MTEDEFRIMHSRLIEYYQLLEMRLKMMCAAFLADEERGWFERLDDYESDPFGLLTQKIKDLQKQTKTIQLTQDDFSTLDSIREKRNYWVHQCFGGRNPVIFYRGQLRHNGYAKKIIEDFNEAVEWDEKLTEIARATEIKYR